MVCIEVQEEHIIMYRTEDIMVNLHGDTEVQVERGNKYRIEDDQGHLEG